MVTTTVEGRERYGVAVRYPRELRSDPERIARIISERRGIPVSVVAGRPDLAAAVAGAPRVANIVTYDWFDEPAQ